MTRHFLAISTILVFASSALQAQTNVTPNLTTVATPGAWISDRYAPTTFGLVNGFQGRDNVLKIASSTVDNLENRASLFRSSYYNTQGRKTVVNTAGSWSFGLDLFINASAIVRDAIPFQADMWATATNDAAFGFPTAYPIIGFTNFGGFTGFRGYNGNTGGWMNFNNPVNLNEWNTLAMSFNARSNTFSYWVNGSLAGSILAFSPSSGVANVMVQTYNFNDPAINPSGTTTNLAAYWSNSQTVIPEPRNYVLMGTGLIGLTLMTRRKKSTQSEV